MLELVIHGEYEAKFIVTSLISQAMKIVVDIEFMQQSVAMLYVKNAVPFAKLFTQACIAHP